MSDSEEYIVELLEVDVDAEGEDSYGPGVNLNGIPIDKKPAHMVH